MVIKSKDYIYINGVSSDTVELYIDTPPVPPMALRRGTNYNINAEEDAFTLEEGFDDITVKIKAYVFFSEDFDNSELYAFLNGARTLQTSRNSKYFYKVKRITSVSPTIDADGKRIKYEISFLCNPFKYHVNNPEIPITHGMIVENNGKIFSRPILKFTATRTLVINVNGTELTVYNTEKDNEIIIDCEKMIAYSGTEMIRTSGYFPLLAVGQNMIKWSSMSVTAASIIVNARCY